MRILKTLPLIGGLLALVLLVRHFGLESLTGALTRVTWWQFAVVCAISGATMVLDTLGWRYTLVTGRPPFPRLLAARCAGQAVNVVTALGGVGGEAIKAWIIRRDIPYDASVPSLILAKTAEVVGQALLLVTGILVAWATGAVGWSLLGPMCYLLIVEVIAVTGSCDLAFARLVAGPRPRSAVLVTTRAGDTGPGVAAPWVRVVDAGGVPFAAAWNRAVPRWRSTAS